MNENSGNKNQHDGENDTLEEDIQEDLEEKIAGVELTPILRDCKHISKNLEIKESTP
jgi:hypothetical protein